MTVADLPTAWLDALQPDGAIGIGLDVATTTKAASNPSGLCVMQRQSPLYVAALMLRAKIGDPSVMREMSHRIVDLLISTGHRPRRFCVDSTNEDFFAQDLRSSLAGKVPVSLIKGSENLKFRGDSINAKKLLGTLYASAFEDNLIAIPSGKWLREDHRLPKKDRGTFVCEVGPNGEHGDTFDSGKLALWALESGGGPARAEAIPVGEFAQRTGRKLLNPLAHLYEDAEPTIFI